ncbi:hypothetical protein ACKWTF_011315 [Chironomus riparius]
MGAIMFKYVQLLCVAFFVNNSNCARKADIVEVEHLKISSRIAMCKQFNPNLTLEHCYNNITSENYTEDIILEYEPQLNETDFHLFCRDAHKMIIEIDHHVEYTDDNETFVYMLILEESTGKFLDRMIYFSEEKLTKVTVDDLSTKESTSLSYNITVYVVSSNAVVQVLGTKMFTTLMEDFRPENITEIEFKDHSDIFMYDLEESFNLTIGWEPARDHTCDYEVIIYGDHMEPKKILLDSQYEYTFANLQAHQKFNVGVRGVNVYKSIRSIEQWREFSLKIYIDFQVKIKHLEDDLYDVNVKWDEIEPRPKSFEIEVWDQDAEINENITTGFYSVKYTGISNSFDFEKLELFGPNIKVIIAGFDEDENEIFIDSLAETLRKKNPSKIMHNLFYASIGFMIILIIVLYKIWKGRIDSFISMLAQKRIEDMDIEAVKSMSSGTVLELISELTKDEFMEVEKDNIAVLEQLGEGAFGLVKKGLVIRNGEKEHVAVKMIKNTSNLEDIKHFHQEIKVMKSVGHHENIVSIVGHCTSDIKYLMLLTEYCDAGNLLDLLRFEFAKQLKFYDTKGKFSSFEITVEKYPDSLLNFDMSERDKKEISYKNIGCSEVQKNLFVVNQMYDDLNNNGSNNGQVLQAIEMTATNALYLKLNSDSMEPGTVIELSTNVEDELNPVYDFLVSSDLLSFAKQICDGMDFLSRKKVVHRDLAARNILVCTNKTVKISDFGLSRDIYQDNFYRKTGNGKLPIKWLALESMTHQVYTSQSDVWSFGILLYEIATLGAVPYSSISVENILKILKTGYRMERPNHCHILLYELMMFCWHANPMERPTFEELSGKLQNYLTMENIWGERIIDLQKMFTQCVSEMNYMKPLV